MNGNDSTDELTADEPGEEGTVPEPPVEELSSVAGLADGTGDAPLPLDGSPTGREDAGTGGNGSSTGAETPKSTATEWGPEPVRTWQTGENPPVSPSASATEALVGAVRQRAVGRQVACQRVQLHDHRLATRERVLTDLASEPSVVGTSVSQACGPDRDDAFDVLVDARQDHVDVATALSRLEGVDGVALAEYERSGEGESGPTAGDSDQSEPESRPATGDSDQSEPAPAPAETDGPADDPDGTAPVEDGSDDEATFREVASETDTASFDEILAELEAAGLGADEEADVESLVGDESVEVTGVESEGAADHDSSSTGETGTAALEPRGGDDAGASSGDGPAPSSGASDDGGIQSVSGEPSPGGNSDGEVTSSGERRGGVGRESSGEDTFSPAFDGDPGETGVTASSKGTADGPASGSTIPTTSQGASDEPAGGDDGPPTDAMLGLSPGGREDGHESADLDSDAVLDALVEALDGSDREPARSRIREALGVGATTSTQVRLDHLQSRVDELLAYADELESFVDATDGGRRVDQLESRLDDLESRLDDLEPRVSDGPEPATTDAAGSEGPIENLGESVSDQSDRPDDGADVRSALAALDEQLDAVESRLADLREWQRRLESAVGDPATDDDSGST